MYAKAGIVTDLHVTVGVVTNGLYADIGITTLSHVTTQYVNENRVFTGIVTNLQVTNSATIANETVTNATITNLTVPSAGGGNADIELANIAQLTSTDITFTDDLIGPDAYFSNDVDSDAMTTRQIGSKYPANPGNEAEQLTIFANAGIYTCIVGFAATIERINMVSGGDGLCAPKITANVGIITALSAGNGGNMTIDAGSAGQIKSFQFESTATTVPPIKTSSTAKCVNLNADLLDGKTTKDTNWTSGASVMTRDSNGSTKVNVITATLFQGGTGAFPTAITGNNATIGGSNSINNLTVSGTFTAPPGGMTGNAESATLAANIQIPSGRVPYNSSNNNTTSSANLTFNGTRLTVNSITASSDFDCNASTGTFNNDLVCNGVFRTDNVRINGNKIDTTSGALTLDSNNNSIDVTADINQTGNFNTTGDVTAFVSDMRLKTSLEQIEGAVAKVCKLSGFTYSFNDTAGELGFDTETRYAGVSAQQVKEVLPEAVKPAAVGKGYMTVQYDKLVPLLIEAVKELKDEIEELKNGR